jgi:hypothetical protein
VHCSFLSQLVRVTAQRAVEGAGNNTINQQSTTKYLVEKHKVLQQVSWLHGQLAELAAWAVGRAGCMGSWQSWLHGQLAELAVVVQLGTQWNSYAVKPGMQCSSYAVERVCSETGMLCSFVCSGAGMQ